MPASMFGVWIFVASAILIDTRRWMNLQPTMHRFALQRTPQSSLRLLCGLFSIITRSTRFPSSLTPGARCRGRFASEHSALVDRVVLFAPIARRKARRYETPGRFPAWRIVTLEDQWNRFVEDVPRNEPPVLSRSHFEDWGKQYLDSDPESRSRDPAGVKTPLGPFSEIIKAWHGQLAYDPALVRSPVAIIRGEWDGLMLDEDAHWLFNAFTQSPDKRDIKIGHGTHLMHLERMRTSLWQESINFLLGHDATPIPK
jgi:alpha-beta hydrolase superfamily lysophospholipase